jgi:hypothetical protein
METEQEMDQPGNRRLGKRWTNRARDERWMGQEMDQSNAVAVVDRMGG